MLDSFFSGDIGKPFSLYPFANTFVFGELDPKPCQVVKHNVSDTYGITKLTSQSFSFTQVAKFPTLFPSNPDRHACLLGLFFISIPEYAAVPPC